MPTPPPQVDLTSDQLKKWEQTRVALLWHCPAFAHVFITMMDNAKSKHIAYFTRGVPIAATDGSNLLLNPDTFFNYDLSERIFICVHEIMHNIWNHMGQMHYWNKRGKVSYPDGSELPYDHKTMNIAQDLVINDLLIESKTGKFNTAWMHDPQLGDRNSQVLDVYKKVYNDPDSVKGTGFDEHLAPGTSTGQDPTQANQGRNEVEWQQAVAAGINAAKVQGKLPAGLERLLGEVVDPKVDWKEQIQALVARKVGSGAYSWQRPDRRLIVRDCYAPGPTGFGAGTVVVGIDTSGSIGDTELNMFMAEMAGILSDVKPERLVIMWCDAALNRVDEAEEPEDLIEIRAKGAPGGGGTSFVPVFDEIYNSGLRPDALVYLTDGYGSFPDKAPPYSVIWGSIGLDKSGYPFGDVVMIPKSS
jgi:predicted metal-dependent peptidase